VPNITHHVNARRPPKVLLKGREYQFRSYLELRFAVLMRLLGWPVNYEPVKIEFEGYAKKPFEWTPDFIVPGGSKDHDVTTVYECMAWLKPQYVLKAQRYRILNPGHKVVGVMSVRDNYKKDRLRIERYERAVHLGHIDHFWYARGDFRNMGVQAEVDRMVAAAEMAKALRCPENT